MVVKKINPWAICSSRIDRKRVPKKYERCVMKVKKKNGIKYTPKSRRSPVRKSKRKKAKKPNNKTKKKVTSRSYGLKCSC